MSNKEWKNRKHLYGRMPLPDKVGHAMKSKKYRYLREIEEDEINKEINDFYNYDVLEDE